MKIRNLVLTIFNQKITLESKPNNEVMRHLKDTNNSTYEIYMRIVWILQSRKGIQTDLAFLFNVHEFKGYSAAVVLWAISELQELKLIYLHDYEVFRELGD